ncbi:TPA: hypothetical protein ACH3X1_010158 [Trebouxia sp. C0004]
MSSTGSDTCVLEKDLILIPVHVSANGTGPPNHWIDVQLDLTTRTIYCLDTLKGRKPLNEIVMSNVLAWTQVEASNAKHASEDPPRYGKEAGHHLKRAQKAECDRYRDDRGGYCNTKAFESCLIAYFCWFKKVKGHVRIEETSFSYNELAFVTSEVLKVLNDDVAKSGVHASQIHSENKAICSSLSAVYNQSFEQ